MSWSRNVVRVLLVEDHDEYARLFDEWLRMTEEAEFEVEAVHRLRDAFTCLDARPDVIVTDLGLPDASGVDAVVSLMEAAPWTSLVVLTVSEDLDVCREALDAGAQDFIVKGRHAPEFYGRILLQAIERKAMQETLDSQSDELRAYTHAVSHDLKSALITLDHLTGRLRDRVLPGDGDGEGYGDRGGAADRETALALDGMEDSLDRMEGLLEEVLRFVRYRAGPGRVEPVSLAALVRESARILEARGTEGGLRIRFDSETQRPQVMGDAMQLRHMVMGLLGGALKGRSGGRAEVVVRLMDDPDGGPFLVLVVEGDGARIPTGEGASSVFRPYGEALLPDEEGADGDGLSLPIARRVARNHDAGVRVVAREGGGRRFEVRFPRKDTMQRLPAGRLGGSAT